MFMDFGKLESTSPEAERPKRPRPKPEADKARGRSCFRVEDGAKNRTVEKHLDPSITFHGKTLMSVVTQLPECANCGASLRGVFCSRCGQKSVALNPTFRELSQELLHELLSHSALCSQPQPWRGDT
jgi:hypothetical protein